MKTAILVDGGYFIKRYHALYPDWRERGPNQVANDLYTTLLTTLHEANKKENNDGHSQELYRIFFYDCPPLSKQVQNPISQRRLDFGKTPVAVFRNQLHEELKKLRKVALRLGRISDGDRWIINPNKTKELLIQKIKMSDLTDADIRYDMRQKGVDMRIGLDISSLSYKKLVDQIILVAGDSDFVPAVKLARREGIDFILDPMWNHINPDLHEHIDGLISCWPKPERRKKENT